jgi:hypothetical protein
MKPKSATSQSDVKTWTKLHLLFLFALACATLPAQAQSYSIDWYNVSGGGGVSTGSVYSVSGTIGQPATGAMAGGNYALQSGFWSMISVVQTPGAPILDLSVVGNSAVLSWPATSAGFVLEQSANLSLPGGWSTVAQAPVTNNGTVSLSVSLTAGNEFFRLYKP